MPSGPIITRFAPSPTGHLHIGGARSALFCWAFAKRAELEHLAKGGTPGQGGRFMIRIEDTDQARSSDESARGILEDLAWLGIEWDDGPRLYEPSAQAEVVSASDQHPTLARGARKVIGENARDVGSYFQAQRAAAGIYNQYIESLIKAGRAYPAFETNEETEAMRKAAVAEKRTFKYPRPADVIPGVFNEARWARAQKGDRHVVRFLMDADAVVVHDQVLGDVKIAPGEVDDFVIRKADGFPTYHFAVVIDDELMGVTHVLRAQEHLANTPRHVAMQRALKRLDNGESFRHPVYAHMPLIFNMDGTKMSKRDKAKAARAAVKQRLGKDCVKDGSVDKLAAEMMAEAQAATPSQSARPPSSNTTEFAMWDLPANALAGGVAGQLRAFVDGEVDYLAVAEAIAKHYKLALPEIEVFDFRRNGYLPEAIINFIALLGWNPGMKLPDGKDLEKFDMDFLAKNFAIDRIGKTNAKFDRAKLLSFNADSIGKLSDAEFAARWRAFLAEYEPEALAALDKRGPAAAITLATIIKPRAKTLRDALTPARFALTTDTGFDYDAKAMDKLKAANGIELLGKIRTALAAPTNDWTPAAIHALMEHLARELQLSEGNAGLGQLAQPLRVAVTGTGVSPGIAETLSILGRDSTLARIDRCLIAAAR
jgi:glutamyl-tRNA synthetase